MQSNPILGGKVMALTQENIYTIPPRPLPKLLKENS